MWRRLASQGSTNKATAALFSAEMAIAMLARIGLAGHGYGAACLLRNRCRTAPASNAGVAETHGLEPEQKLSIAQTHMCCVAFLLLVCRNCIRLVGTVVETVVEIVVNYIENVEINFKQPDILPPITMFYGSCTNPNSVYSCS